MNACYNTLQLSVYQAAIDAEASREIRIDEMCSEIATWSGIVIKGRDGLPVTVTAADLLLEIDWTADLEPYGYPGETVGELQHQIAFGAGNCSSAVAILRSVMGQVAHNWCIANHSAYLGAA